MISFWGLRCPLTRLFPPRCLPRRSWRTSQKNLDLAFAAFRRQKDKLSMPRFNIAETGTHGVSTIVSSQELDSNIATLSPRFSSPTSVIHDRKLVHLDVTIRRTLSLLSILSATDAIAMSVAHAKTSEESYIKGTLNLINRNSRTSWTISHISWDHLLLYCEEVYSPGPTVLLKYILFRTTNKCFRTRKT